MKYCMHGDPSTFGTGICADCGLPVPAERQRPNALIPWEVLDDVLNADSVANDYRMKPRVLIALRELGYGPK